MGLAADFDQELESHLAMAEEDKIRQGLTPAEARRKARQELGGLAQLRDAAHDARGRRGSRHTGSTSSWDCGCCASRGALLGELHADGATICLVTHDPRYSRYAERSIQLFDGRILADAAEAPALVGA